MYGAESGDHGDEGYKRAAEFANKLKEKYPDYKRMHVWYVLVGGTPEERFGILEEDFPGEDSVVAFLERILKERHD